MTGSSASTDATRPFLQKQRPKRTAVFGVCATAVCRMSVPVLSSQAAYRLAPLEEPEPLQRMDPLTKGSLFHRVQAEFLPARAAEGKAPQFTTAQRGSGA